MGLVHCTGASSVNSGKIGSKDAGDGDGVELDEFAVRNRSVESNPCHSPERGWYRSSESVAAYCIKAQYCMYSVAERNVRKQEGDCQMLYVTRSSLFSRHTYTL